MALKKVKEFTFMNIPVKKNFISIWSNFSTTFSSSITFIKLEFNWKKTKVWFYRYLLVNHRERRIVIVESLLCPTEFREILANVLFVHFEVLYQELSLIQLWETFYFRYRLSCLCLLTLSHFIPWGSTLHLWLILDMRKLRWYQFVKELLWFMLGKLNLLEQKQSKGNHSLEN